MEPSSVSLIMKEFGDKLSLFHESYVVNWHEHVRESKPGKLDEKDADCLVEYSSRIGTDKILCSRPISRDPYCPPEDFRRCNDVVYNAMRRHPGKILGMCFINPGYGDKAIDELKRCVTELGMVGVKLYHQYFIDNPAQHRLVEECIKLDIPILMHAGKVCDKDTMARQPRISNGEHFANLARRYPEASLIMAHIGGGGDWHWSLKAIEKHPNICIDMSGSIYDSPIIEESVAYLGADRILFGTDRSFSSCVGKILGANISDDKKRTILEGTAFLRFIERVSSR